MSGRASKQKGSTFERLVCVRLSLWVTGGKSKDCFWRSAMSGGRASRSVDALPRQAGDISAVAPEGHVLTDKFYIELKHLKDIELTSFILSRAGTLWREWQKACNQAKRFGRRPMMIVKQNSRPTLVLTMPLSASRREPVAVMPWAGVYMYSFDALLQQRFTIGL